MTTTRQNNTDKTQNSHWYRQPVAWLGIIITLAIIVGCIWTIRIGMRYHDVHVNDNSSSIMGVPLLDEPASKDSTKGQ